MGNTKKTAKAAQGKSSLHSNALPAAHLTEIGGRWNGTELIALWHAVQPKVASHQALFAALGFDAKWGREMDTLVTQIEADVETKSALANDALPTADALNGTIAQCKEWRRDAATRVAISPKLTARAPKIQTGSSPSRLEVSMRAFIPLVASRDCAAPGGAAMKAQGQKLLKQLGVELKKHKGAVGKLSGAIRARNMKEGVLYEELKRLARAARTIIPNEAHLFALSSHARTRLPSRARASKADGAGSHVGTTPSDPTNTG